MIATKKYLTLIALSFTIVYHGLGQWTANTVGGNSADANYVNGKIKVTSTGGSVAGDNNYQGIVVNHNNFYTANVSQAFTTVPAANQFKAQAGVPFTITLEIMHKFFPDGFYGENWSTTHQVFLDYFPGDCFSCGGDWFNGTIGGFQGKNEQDYLYDNAIALTKSSQYVQTYEDQSLFLATKSTFTGTYTFPVGRTRGWIVLGFREKSYTIYNQSSHNNFIVLPFVVEGPTSTSVDSLGTTTKPQIPQMVIHTPPGDGSSTKITNTGRKCRKFEESYSRDLAGTLYGAFKLGYKGSIGFIATVDVEAYVEFSASATAGGFQTRTSNQETCVTVSDALTAQSAGKGAQGNDLFVGYGIDLAYGLSRNVSIQNNAPVLDTSLVYRPLPETLKEFFLTKSGIEQDIVTQQGIVNDSINNTVAERATAQYQIDVWQQVLDQNEANIAAAAGQTGELNEFNGKSNKTYNTSIQYTTAQTIQAGHYLKTSVGIEGAAYIAGSGFKLGAKFTTNQRFGEFQSVSGGQTEDVMVTWSDDDEGDHFDFKVVKDPVYGTPIFILDSLESRTSCPYEGGIQRDMPRLEILGTTDSDTSISNISLGTSGNFRVKACNDSDEERKYDFGFVGQSIANDLILTSAASEGTQVPNSTLTKFQTISEIPSGGCKVETFDINASRRNAGSEMNYENIEFQLYAECQPSIKSSIMANLNWAGPPPPTGVSASKTELCNPSPITLVADCPPTTTARWYTTETGGFPFEEGESVSATPTGTVTYFVGCETPEYARDRVATQEVLMANNGTTLNLTTDINSNSLHIADTDLTATNTISAPAKVKYKAGISLLFNTGFEVRSGGILEAQIGGCED